MKFPLPLHTPKDCWTRDASKDGEFTVRSAYHLAMTEKSRDAVSTSHTNEALDWNLIWNAAIYPKKKSTLCGECYKEVLR